MKRLLFAIVGIVALALMYGTGKLYLEHRSLSEEAAQSQSRLDALKAESEQLQSDFRYYSDPQNLEKYLRNQFNYKNPGEKLIITVPQQASTTTN